MPHGWEQAMGTTQSCRNASTQKPECSYATQKHNNDCNPPVSDHHYYTALTSTVRQWGFEDRSPIDIEVVEKHRRERVQRRDGKGRKEERNRTKPSSFSVRWAKNIIDTPTNTRSHPQVGIQGYTCKALFQCDVSCNINTIQ